jgi:ABC-type transport system involved in cytochrome c biogenesis ATPase subunit
MTSALRGRDSEVCAVLALLGRARAGQSGALVIRGEAGTGKTALLDVAAGQRHGPFPGGGPAAADGRGILG